MKQCRHLIQQWLILLVFLCMLAGCSQAPIDTTSQQEETVRSTIEVQPTEDGAPDTNLPISEEPKQPLQDESSSSALYSLPENSTFEIVFLDVGQADSALISCDGHHMLIDGGNKADSNLLYAVLQKKEISHLDLVVGTHGHEDHIGGIPGALSYATTDVVLSPVTTYDSEAFTDFKAYSGALTIPEIGDQYTLGSATVDILGLNAADDANNTSIILKITYGNTTFLFTGDAEYEAEQAVLNSGADLSATVLKVGHHGSDTSTSYQFLRAVMPQYGIISCGADNSYGHPTDAVLSRLRDAEVTVYRTDLQGDIVCVSDGETVTFTTDKIVTEADLLSAGSTITSTQVDTSDVVTPDESTSGEYRYILNTSTMKFHEPTCGSAAKIAEKNYAESSATREELIAQGYDPCGNCDP